MSRTITALFDTKADAEAGAERLRQAGVDADSVSVHDKSSHAVSGEYSTQTDQGLWAKIKSAMLPDEDRHTYEEGVRRGGFLLTADVDDDATPGAVKALEDANSIDLDERSQQWRSDGWNYGAENSAAGDDDFTFAERDSDFSTNRYRSYGSGRRD